MGNLEPIEGLQLPGKSWMVNCSQFGAISALTTVAATHPPTTAMWQAAVHVFYAQPEQSL